MYAATTGTFLQRDPAGYSGDGVLGYSHEAVTRIMQARRSSFGPIDPNLYEYAVSIPLRFTDPRGLAAEPGFWSGYWYYLWTPGQMDSDLQTYQQVAVTTAVVAGAGAGGLGAASYYGITAVGVVPISQVPATVAMEYQLAMAAAAAAVPLTAAQVQRLVAQSGDRVVTVFTRLSQTPAGNRALHTAMDPRLCQALPNSQATQMFTGRIPSVLFNDMVQRGLIRVESVNMSGVTANAYVITQEGMQLVQQYFK